jgi:glycine dehydrogenase subunit 1
VSYIANTPDERREMLETVGATMEELFADIPDSLRPKSFDLPDGMSEFAVKSHLEKMSARNNACLINFLGGGFYDHFVPAVVDHVMGRSEFYTAYTPYQPEASQGTLQALYEFQSAINRLTEMDATNASLYDGGTAIYEAIIMAMRCTRGRRRVLVCETVNPIYRKMIRSYMRNLNIALVEVPPTPEGLTDRETMAKHLDDTVAAVVVQTPNFFGCLDDMSSVAELAHEVGALMVLSYYPTSLGLMKTPGAMGADIATAEGQCLGLPLNFGGPYLGLMSCTKKLVRKIPGRVAGATVDREGKRAFVLTLQAREQHIRREKATSNICSNESLFAIGALAYMCAMGKQGLVEVAEACRAKAAYCREKLLAIEGVSSRFDAPVFNEFVLDLPKPADEAIDALIRHGYAAGFPLDRYYNGFDQSILVAVTEKRTRAEIDRFARILEDIL